jgi:DDE family transposase
MMMQDALPGIKRFLKTVILEPWVKAYVISFLAGFVSRVGRMSASQAGQAIRTQARHRANVVRFLASQGWRGDWCGLERVAQLVLEAEAACGGTWALLLDQTLVGQQGHKTENTFSTGNRKRRPCKGRRFQKYKYARKSCHCFVMGLLLTPSGIRIPCWRSYYTETYCAEKKKPYRKQTELAAELIAAALVPERADVVVLGDTAFDAECIRDACAARNFKWIVPMNPERVLAGPKGKRPRVRSLLEKFSASQFAPVRLTPGQGRFVAQRRIARCRLGPKVKTRTWYVHEERRKVHSVGEVQLVFSAKEEPKRGKPVQVEKILMTNDCTRSVAEVVELYTLRWQIELFFKELKSTLGFHQYRLRSFVKVETWVALCLLTFLYLEWYRASQLRKRDLTSKEKAWWRWQRTYGLTMAVRDQAEEAELSCLANWARTRSGLKKLKRLLRSARPLEYRQPERKAG